ncbi:YdcH family protein [Maribius pontilimi]|uniref:YdcH family protein n=1 Tax=Palleronia pontilimi TaxID=1964209 RepID=A0A934ME07_9RHOB|nr:DUF465 domain-containing protein [Palleronia pontilimi]MBJ3764493.1 YdcH family protein [Palleronia pontilimi]
MPHTPHELARDLPSNVVQLKSLRNSNRHFLRLCEAYQEVNRAIRRAETHVEPTSDEHLSEMRRRRVRLQDDIARWLSQE